MRAPMLAALLIKYLRIFSHTSVKFSEPADCGALRTEITVLKRRIVTVRGNYNR